VRVVDRAKNSVAATISMTNSCLLPARPSGC
jgi:hypothetical protein